MEFDAPGAHEFDICLCGGVAVLEYAGFLCLAPEDLIVAVGVEGRVDVDKVHAAVGQVAKLVEIVAAVDDAGIDKG